ncbi:MAG: phosphotransferase [Clostridia bacterium]|nr:phosphotransferase [Clostridia bacterium]
MKFTVNNGELSLFLAGRVDSVSAPAVEAEIEKIRSETAHTSVTLDADDLEYISSAGLRIVLRLRKNEPTLRVINASAEVYEIFEMTGFIEMIPVEKGYRKLSVEGCESIGKGANGEVFRLDPDTIIKVYLNPDSLPDIKRERDLARRAFVLGVPTAIPYDVVKVGAGYGSVFELLNAKSLATLIAENPDKLDEYVGIYVDLMKKIHSTEVRPEDMPDMKEVGVNWAKFLLPYLPEKTGAKLVSLVEGIRDDNHMLHGDYHIKNVMIQNGEALLIDMDTLCHGHRVFELASMFNAYVGFLELDHDMANRFLGVPYETCLAIWEKTLHLYLGTTDPAEIAAVEKRAMVIGYTRLMRREIRRGALDTEQGRAKTEYYKSKIIALVDEVDTLDF